MTSMVELMALHPGQGATGYAVANKTMTIEVGISPYIELTTPMAIKRRLHAKLIPASPIDPWFRRRFARMVRPGHNALVHGPRLGILHTSISRQYCTHEYGDHPDEREGEINGVYPRKAANVLENVESILLNNILCDT